MSYPTYILAVLNEVGGTSCGQLSQRMQYVANSNPPMWLKIQGEGDFYYAICVGVHGSSGIETFELTIRYYNPSTPCDGLHQFHRSPSADDPTGSYCKYINGQLDCDGSKASVYNDD